MGSRAVPPKAVNKSLSQSYREGKSETTETQKTTNIYPSLQGFHSICGAGLPTLQLSSGEGRKPVTGFIYLAALPSDLVKKSLLRGLGVGRTTGHRKMLLFWHPPRPLHALYQPCGPPGEPRVPPGLGAPAGPGPSETNHCPLCPPARPSPIPAERTEDRAVSGSPTGLKHPRSLGVSNCEHYFVLTSSEGSENK